MCPPSSLWSSEACGLTLAYSMWLDPELADRQTAGCADKQQPSPWLSASAPHRASCSALFCTLITGDDETRRGERKERTCIHFAMSPTVLHMQSICIIVCPRNSFYMLEFFSDVHESHFMNSKLHAWFWCASPVHHCTPVYPKVTFHIILIRFNFCIIYDVKREASL